MPPAALPPFYKRQLVSLRSPAFRGALCSPSPWPDPGLPRTPLPPPHPKLPRLSPQAALLNRPVPCDCYTAAPDAPPPRSQIPLPPMAGPHATAKARGGIIRGHGLRGLPPTVSVQGPQLYSSTRQRHKLRFNTWALPTFKPQTSHMNLRGLDGVKSEGGRVRAFTGHVPP